MPKHSYFQPRRPRDNRLFSPPWTSTMMVNGERLPARHGTGVADQIIQILCLCSALRRPVLFEARQRCLPAAAASSVVPTRPGNAVPVRPAEKRHLGSRWDKQHFDVEMGGWVELRQIFALKGDDIFLRTIWTTNTNTDERNTSAIPRCCFFHHVVIFARPCSSILYHFLKLHQWIRSSM